MQDVCFAYVYHWSNCGRVSGVSCQYIRPSSLAKNPHSFSMSHFGIVGTIHWNSSSFEEEIKWKERLGSCQKEEQAEEVVNGDMACTSQQNSLRLSQAGRLTALTTPSEQPWTAQYSLPTCSNILPGWSFTPPVRSVPQKTSDREI